MCGQRRPTFADFVVAQTLTSDPPGMEFFKKVEKSGAKESFTHGPPAPTGELPQPEAEWGNPQEETFCQPHQPHQQGTFCQPHQSSMPEVQLCAQDRRSSYPPPRQSAGRESEASIASSDSMKHGRIFAQLLEADIGDARDADDHIRIKNEAAQLTKRRVYTKTPAEAGGRAPWE